MHLAQDLTMNGRIVVEFVGLPGVGKSALSHRVAEIMQQRGFQVEQPTYVVHHGMHRWERYLLKLLVVPAEMVLHPAHAARSARAILRTRQSSAGDFIGLTVNWFFMCSLLRRAKARGGVQFFDEGLVNALWSIGFRASADNTPRILEELARQHSSDVAAALIEADIPTVKERLASRKNSESRLDRASRDDDWGRAAVALEQVKATLRALADQGAPIRVIPVRNDRVEQLEENARYLAAAFEQMLR